MTSEREIFMQSRQIQIFGLIGTAILLLFIVIFLGKDFHHLYQHYFQHETLPALNDDQIVMDAHTVRELEEKLNEESETVLAGYKAESNKMDMTRDSEASDILQTERSEETAVLEEEQSRIIKTSTSSEVATTAQSEKIEHVKRVSDESSKSAIKPESTIAPGTNAASKPERSAVDLTEVNIELKNIIGNGAFFHHELTLTQDNRKILDEAAKEIERIGSGYRLEVEGHTKEGLAKAYSMKMAEKVAAYLRKVLPGIVITTVGYGNEYPISDDLNDASNTRIELIVRRSE
jgi:outer membrane protein OmpA-like peptidoglycan-associated protein